MGHLADDGVAPGGGRVVGAVGAEDDGAEVAGKVWKEKKAVEGVEDDLQRDGLQVAFLHFGGDVMDDHVAVFGDAECPCGGEKMFAVAAGLVENE